MRLLLLLFLGVLSIASAVLVNSGCPKEAVPSEDGKTCFTIVKAKVKINVAVNVCKSFGGVITEDAGEYNYLMENQKFKTKGLYWLKANSTYSRFVNVTDGHGYKHLIGRVIPENPENVFYFQEDKAMFVCKCQNTCHRPASPVFPRAAMLWERNLKETNGYVYRLFRERMSWTEAVKACEAEGAQLVTIRSRKNQDFVGGIAKNNPTWIGARQIGRSLQWMDGSGVAGMQENRELRDPWWHDNVEFFGKDTCLNIYLKRWATKKCESDLPFVCEKKL